MVKIPLIAAFVLVAAGVAASIPLDMDPALVDITDEANDMLVDGSEESQADIDETGPADQNYDSLPQACRANYLAKPPISWVAGTILNGANCKVCEPGTYNDSMLTSRPPPAASVLPVKRAATVHLHAPSVALPAHI